MLSRRLVERAYRGDTPSRHTRDRLDAVKRHPVTDYFVIDAYGWAGTCLHYGARMLQDMAAQDVMVELNNSGIDNSPSARASAPPVLDAACMAEIHALDPDGRAQLVKRVLLTYQTSLHKLAGQMDEARQAAAWDQVGRVAHTLKSSSASVGALALSALCADIERLVRADDSTAAGALLDDFQAEAAGVILAVASTLERLEAAA